MTAALLLAATLAAAPAPRLGADLTITRPTRGPVVSLLGSLRVEAEVSGDVIALGGDVVLGPAARVGGDAVAVGGAVTGEGAVSGRAVSVGALGAALAAGPAPAPARLAWGMRALRLGGWLLLASLLLLAFPRQVRRGGEHLRAMPVRTVAAGALSLLVWLVLVLLALALSASRAGVLLLLAGVAVFLAAKVLGLLAVAWVAGRALRAALPPSCRGEIAATGAGMFALAVLGLVPGVGQLAWLAANVAGVGAIVAALLAPRLAAALPLVRAARS